MLLITNSKQYEYAKLFVKKIYKAVPGPKSHVSEMLPCFYYVCNLHIVI